MRLGIDFGTTRTVAAGQEGGNYPVYTFSWKGEMKEYIPSIAAAKDGTLYFGWEALSLLDEPDVYLLRSMKRLAGHLRPDDILEMGPAVSVNMLDLVTMFLSHVKSMLLKHSTFPSRKKTVLEAVVATPANANSNQRYITLEAFRRAGFNVLCAMNEPSAAAVEFLHRYLRNVGPRSPKRHVAVYDLGGGTFDTSVVAIVDRHHDVLAHKGIAKLGGDDFDEIILDLVLEEAGITRNDLRPSAVARLLEECKERKEGLKANTKKMVVDLGAIVSEKGPVVLETALVYSRCEPLIQNSLDMLRCLLDRLGEAPEDSRSLAAVYLVGGSVAFPPVSRSIREIYPKKVKTSPFPHASTAIGLAIAGDPEARITVQEAVSRHFGIWRERGQDKVFDPIFSKDRQVDPNTGSLKVSRIYHPMHNVGLLRYMECSSLGKDGEPEGDIALWKDTYFPYDPTLRNRRDLSKVPVRVCPELSSQEIIETYEYDEQGSVRVEIENRTFGYRKLFTLEPEIGT
ncbi:MAG: Hsp70 family protein [Deltaproteobacteria bacterium]|nr:Hsp70 family protein [Deltaproteobacteria bacterium]